MGASSNTTDSNVSGLAFAEEVLGSPGTLSSPTWYALDPNSYGDFGGQTATVKRETINASRQKRKGVVVGIDAAAAFQVDFTSKALYRYMQGFMFADWREKDNLAVTAVSTTVYTVASGGAAFTTTDLLYAENFAGTANNGLKNVSASTATSVTPVGGGMSAESPPASRGCRITRVGFQGASADLTMTVVGGRPQLNSTALDFTTKGLIPGEWVWIGDSSNAAYSFATAACNGWYRVLSIGTNVIIFDRWPSTPTADAGTGKTLRVFLGHVIKNEATSALQKFRTYQLERQFNATNVEYVKGAGANEISLNVKTRDKVTVDVAFVGLDTEALTSPKAGTRVGLEMREATYNAATSFSRMHFYDDTGAASLATYLTDLKLTINNGITVADGITNQLGGIDLTSGDFMVSGTLEAYFSAVAAVNAVKNNVDAALSFGMVENATVPGIGAQAQGWLFDVPLIGLGDGRLKVEKDKPVKLPLNLEAAGHETLNHTLLAQRFAYLPQSAL